MHANEKALAELSGVLSKNASSPQSPKKIKLEAKVNGAHTHSSASTKSELSPNPNEDSISALVEVNANSGTAEKPKIFSCSICKERFSSR